MIWLLQHVAANLNFTTQKKRGKIICSRGYDGDVCRVCFEMTINEYAKNIMSCLLKKDVCLFAEQFLDRTGIVLMTTCKDALNLL